MTIGRQALATPTNYLPVTDELLEDIVQRIVEAFAPKRIILFGSYAWGEPEPNSDVDLFIVMDDGGRPAWRSARIARVLLDFPFPIDILVRTPEELQHRLQIGDYFVQEILGKGRVLYERN